MSNPYAPDKALYHRDNLEAVHRGGSPYPVHVHFVISDLCNQNCSFCAYRIDNYTETFAVPRPDGTLNHNPNRKIETLTAYKILEGLRSCGVKAVQFTGGGEPTVHPDCANIMRRAQELGMETALVTNGTRLTPDLMRAILASRWVRVSLDEYTPEGYAKLRESRPGVFLDVLGNIKKMAETKKSVASEVTIGVGYVVTKDNWQGVAKAASLAREAGADNFRISAVFQPDDIDYFADFVEEAAHLCSEAQRAHPAGFVVNNFPSRTDDLALGHPDYPRCGYQYFTTYIGADLNVYRCCVTSYTNHGLLGNLGDYDSFAALWTQTHKNDTFDARTCPRCQFNDKNRAINDWKPPTHRNFV